ncbi:MAG: site-specific integrase [Burkholderiales bacterium]|nr:site-specific integrase [Phycisphaerae bacterium]
MIPSTALAGLEAVESLKAGKTIAPDSPPVQPVDIGHVESTLRHMPPLVASMVRLQLATGMRSGELCSMRTKDIDTTGDVWVYRPEKHKNTHRGHTREVAIGPKGQAILRHFLRPDLDAPIFSPAVAMAERRALRRASRKTPMNQGNRPRLQDEGEALRKKLNQRL